MSSPMPDEPGSSAPRGSARDSMADPHGPEPSPNWLQGRVAIVTGGGLSGPAGGVGYAVCCLFARHGARVAVVDRDPDAAQATAAEIEKAGGTAICVIGDVAGDEDCYRAVETTVERFGGLDTLVNNAASGDRATLFDVSPQRWDELIGFNLKSAWSMTRHAASAMTGGGAVVNVSSAAVARPGPGTVYGIAKAGVENMTKGAASLLGPQGIRVNCVQLGEIWTSMAARDLPPEARERRRQGVALKTEGTGWDAAYAALFLASDRARWVSGHVMAVEGGGPHRGTFPSRSREAAAQQSASEDTPGAAAQ